MVCLNQGGLFPDYEITSGYKLERLGGSDGWKHAEHSSHLQELCAGDPNLPKRLYQRFQGKWVFDGF